MLLGKLNQFLPNVSYMEPVDTKIFDLFCNDKDIDFSGRASWMYSYPDELSFLTILEDHEAISICRGLHRSNVGFKAWKRNERGKPKPEDIYLMQKAAMEAMEHYGFSKISKLMALPTADFSTSRFTEAFSELDKRLNHVENPVIRMTFMNGSNNEQEIFTLKFDKSKNVLNKDEIVMREKTRGEQLRIHRSGSVRIHLEAVVTQPILRLLIKFCSDPEKVVANYGLVLGACGLCGRELSNPRSLNAGYGETCARNQRYPY